MQPKQLQPIQHHDYREAQGKLPKNPLLDFHNQSLYSFPFNLCQNETKIGAQGGLLENSPTSKQLQRQKPAITEVNINKTKNFYSFQEEKKINQHRNNLPNQLNQVVTVLTHSNNFEPYIRPIFKRLGQQRHANGKLFCQYIKNIKAVNQRSRLQNFLQIFFEIHSSDYQIYPRELQELYMKVARIGIWKFLNNEAIINVLRSRKMHKENKPSHLMTIRCLKNHFIRYCRQKQR